MVLRRMQSASKRKPLRQFPQYRGRSLAAQGQCASALEIVRHLGDPVSNLSFTTKGLRRFVESDSSKQAMEEIQVMCRTRTSGITP